MHSLFHLAIKGVLILETGMELEHWNQQCNNYCNETCRLMGGDG